jgi:sulfite reductase (NADPH) flavoprotein alpha-component
MQMEQVTSWVGSPFDAALGDEVKRLVARLDARQRLWLSGYLMGAAEGVALPASIAPEKDERPLVTVLYGSQSGNSEQIARDLSESLSRRGISTTLLDMLECRKNHLQETQHLLVVVSTHGEGDPPDSAVPLYELLHGRKAPRLEHLKYAVLALGDSSYEKFCETGRRFDVQLEALGAHRFHPCIECDVDFHAPAQQWMSGIIEELAREHAARVPAPSATPVAARSASIATAYTRKNPFLAPVLINQRLTTNASSKDVRHIEVSIEDSGIHYEPGDALGVVPRNHEDDVAELLNALPFAGDTAVEVGGQTVTLSAALTDHYDIGLLTRAALERYVEASPSAGEVRELLAGGREEDLSRFLRGRHLIDLITAHPLRELDVGAFTQLLRPLQPRLYSIASSPRATPDEVHLTVSVVRYESYSRARRGVVSCHLAELLGDDAKVAVYPHRNPSFRLPANQEAPIIMIGPGTGVAPFRSFVAEREAVGAKGRNWLFFGDRSFHNDFLYQTDWLDWRRRGVLHRMDVAFSRDGAQKVYVQHRMLEQGQELYAWLEAGAHLYVCGDAEFMAPDVDAALRQVVQRHGGLSEERADEYVLELQRQRRYQKDVY